MNRTRVLATVLTVSISLLVAACGDGADDEAGASAGSCELARALVAAKGEYEIILSSESMGSDVRAAFDALQAADAQLDSLVETAPAELQQDVLFLQSVEQQFIDLIQRADGEPTQFFMTPEFVDLLTVAEGDEFARASSSVDEYLDTCSTE